MKIQNRFLAGKAVAHQCILKLGCIFSWFFILACEGDLKYDLVMNDYRQQLVVNCTFTNDSTWMVFVSKSSGISEDESWEVVDNAVIAITDANGAVTTLQPINNGQYHSLQQPEYNQSYTISVTVPGCEIVEASDFQPGPVEIDSVELYDSIAFEDEAYISQSIIKITDDEAATNFYQINVYQTDSTGQPLGIMIKSDDIAIENAENASITNDPDYQEYLVANDQLFNGTDHSFIIKFIKAFPENDVYIVVRSLSESLHEYLLTYSIAMINMDNPFAEPAEVYSNIINGVGIFGGYSSDMKRIDINNY